MRTAILCIFLLLPAFAHALPCANDEEQRALNVRALMSELMIAGLSCDERDNYSRFVSQHKSYLGEQARVMRAYFARHYKRGSESQMNRFVTRIANTTSRDSWGGDMPFCEHARQVFSDVNSMSEEEMDRFVANARYTTKTGVSCGKMQTAKAKEQKFAKKD
ncbi:MAG: hypothetical protein J0L97_10095 [Alphaproteobacteria bacterium]|nr:hypothetical protein [Alphaproteobacteria bacterium]